MTSVTSLMPGVNSADLAGEVSPSSLTARLCSSPPHLTPPAGRRRPKDLEEDRSSAEVYKELCSLPEPPVALEVRGGNQGLLSTESLQRPQTGGDSSAWVPACSLGVASFCWALGQHPQQGFPFACR